MIQLLKDRTLEQAKINRHDKQNYNMQISLIRNFQLDLSKQVQLGHDTFPCLIEWFHDGMIHDTLCLASSSFELKAYSLKL